MSLKLIIPTPGGGLEKTLGKGVPPKPSNPDPHKNRSLPYQGTEALSAMIWVAAQKLSGNAEFSAKWQTGGI